MYTYVLKDLVQEIYKIGKTTDPAKRFSVLCELGKVVPIALVEKDVEAELHARFAENRIVNESASNGKTEWFRTGGKIDKFINKIDTGKSLPYITVARMVNHLLASNVIKYRDSMVSWEIEQAETGLFYIGLEILYQTGFATRIKSGFSPKSTAEVTMYKEKITVAESVISHIIENYTVELFSDCVDKESIDNPTNAPIRKIRLDHITNVVILITKK